jgi:hypothetical protein
MTQREKRRFIRELIGSVKKTVIANVAKMPEEWDGIELREYLADKFAESRVLMSRPDMKRRLKDYRNEVLVRNL